MLDLICHPKRSADFKASTFSCLKKVEDSPLTFGLKHMINNCQLSSAAIMDHNVLFNQEYKQIDIIQPASLITLT